MNPPPVVALDATGADLGPAEVAAGAALAAGRGVRVRIFGPAAAMAEALVGSTVDVVDAPVSIAKEPDPARAVREHPDAAIVQAARAVGAGEAQALVAGGTTGAALAAGVLHVRRARGVHRPALAVPLPVPGSPVTLLDVGASVEARPEHLVQYAFMGAALARTVLGVAAPRVGLLSNGSEPERGTAAVVAAHALLRERLADGRAATFVGNVEGVDLTAGVADVVVCDGFAGNVALKTAEGVVAVLIRAIREAARTGPVAAAGGLLLRPALGRLRDDLDPERVGGAYLLGLRGLGVVPHGRFTRDGIAEAVVRAARGAEADLVGRLHADLESAGALRARPAATGSDAPGG